VYFGAGALVLVAIFFMRWNVVLGGQLFSKSLRGLTVYKIGLAGAEGVITSVLLALLPFMVLLLLVKILPPWQASKAPATQPGDARPAKPAHGPGSSSNA
jgi:predicted membrane protein